MDSVDCRAAGVSQPTQSRGSTACPRPSGAQDQLNSTSRQWKAECVRTHGQTHRHRQEHKRHLYVFTHQMKRLVCSCIRLKRGRSL